ncbi:MAG: 2-amino-4-hydroxy-6-hydroxymethyldihydropteridine pyrophosphokinae [Acidobacteriaceae bacterium]|nr:2-amino-4-hydroxy-6-hydroxymethyldihydropteridine pyrophosphokinae [Acidobacteriaceae bacterium]
MPIAAIALGANLPSPAGVPAETLAAATGRFNSLGSVLARSSLYRTAPVGYLDQPEFVNAVVLLETSLAPMPLLDRLLAIERSFGRERGRGPAKGPRSLDLDLLLYDDLVLQEPALTLPHPAMHQRRFVLAPLAEIAPEWRHPGLGRSVRQLLDGLPRDEGEVLEMYSL